MTIKIVKVIFYTLLIISIILLLLKYFNVFSNKFYKNIKDIDKPNKIDVLVNKNNRLNKFYKPKDLVKINEKYSNKDKYLRKAACYFFEKMSEQAYRDGFKIKAASTYRSYFYQKELFDYYVRTMGENKALMASAKPGHSEHQTGLVVDVMGSFGDYNSFENTPEFEWMKQNAYKYGFILRYPKGKEKITGFKYEPWHYRYVGKKIAKKIHENNLTLEEYKKEKN